MQDLFNNFKNLEDHTTCRILAIEFEKKKIRCGCNTKIATLFEWKCAFFKLCLYPHQFHYINWNATWKIFIITRLKTVQSPRRWQNWHDLYMTCTWLEHYLNMTWKLLGPDLNMSCTWLAHDLHVTCTWLAHDLHMTCTWLAHALHMTTKLKPIFARLFDWKSWYWRQDNNKTRQNKHRNQRRLLIV